jgi:hypothetical protein
MSLPASLLAADKQRQLADWDAALVWRPAWLRDGTLYQFPRPIPQVRIHETWDAARFKVPLTDGDALSGGSRNGVDITLVGQIVVEDAADPPALLTALSELRDALHVTGDDDKAWLFLYHDAEAEVYRHFRGCSTVRFHYELVDGLTIAYEALLHAEDATLYETGPEE